MVTIEMVNNRSQVSFFTVPLDYEESFIEQMQNAGWMVLGYNYHNEEY